MKLKAFARTTGEMKANDNIAAVINPILFPLGILIPPLLNLIYKSNYLPANIIFMFFGVHIRMLGV